MLAAKQEEAAACFEMGRYYEVSGRLDIATSLRDAGAIVEIAKEMISSVEEIDSFQRSPLYKHMEFKKISEEFKAELKENLLQCFRDEESYGFLKDYKEWQELLL